MSLTREEVVVFLKEAVRERLGEEAAADAAGDLFEAGLDSIQAVEITAALEDRFGLVIDPGLVFEARSIDAIADALPPAAPLA